MTAVALLAGLLSGIIGAMGLGGGAVLIIYLALFTSTDQITAQGINLIFFIPIGITALIIYSKKGKIKWKIALPISLGGLFGALIGIYFSNYFNSKTVGKFFGVFLIVLGIIEIFRKNIDKCLNNSCKKDK